MSEDRSWAADTVAFGRAPREPRRPDPPRRRSARPRLPTIPLRPMALVTVAIVGVVALIAVAGGGSDSSKAPIREVADPVPRVVVRPARRVPPQSRRRDRRSPAGRRVREADVKKREPKREAAAGPETQTQDVYKLPTEAAPVYVPPPAPAPPSTPTSPAAEFGL